MIEILKNSTITSSLQNNHRQYLVGNLQLPQELTNIHDDNVELGITKYSNFKFEVPHFHTEVTEYQMILDGAAKYVDLSQNQEYLLEKGDVFVIRPNTTYIQKSPKGTVILFFKYPGKNDKVTVTASEKMLTWASAWDIEWT